MADSKRSKSIGIAVIVGLVLIWASLMGIQKVFQERGLVTGKPGMNRFPEASPGETQILDRAYEGAPPLIPHGVADISITREQNECLDCHLEGVEVDEGHVATKIPESHFKNDFTGETTEDEVIGIRYNCSQCHVPQVEEEPPYTELLK